MCRLKSDDINNQARPDCLGQTERRRPDCTFDYRFEFY